MGNLAESQSTMLSSKEPWHTNCNHVYKDICVQGYVQRMKRVSIDDRGMLAAENK